MSAGRRLTALLSLMLASTLLVACGATGNGQPGAGAHDATDQATAPTSTTPALGSPTTPALDPAPDPTPASSLAEVTGLNVHAGIRTDCQVDSDCAVVDIGNCCGSYPACVRAGSQVDPAAVQAECGERDLAGICGFPVIDNCVCSTGRCQAMQRGTGPVQ